MLGVYLNVWSSLLSVEEALFKCFASDDDNVDPDLVRELRIACTRFAKAIDVLDGSGESQ